MGGGAGLSMHTPFRIVTENTIFSMPEASFGGFPDCGASHFLSRLPGFFGEYIGLTGAYLDGTEMLACGLATHFVLSKDVGLMEEALAELGEWGLGEMANISKTINEFAHKTHLKKDSPYGRLEVIEKCFSAETVEEILYALEKSVRENEDKWIIDAIKSMRSFSPTSLKIFLRLIREGRSRSIEKCLVSEFRVFCHVVRRAIGNDLFEGVRALLFEKDRKPQIYSVFANGRN
ncbi:hypothetical protein M9H77_06277 [Catharanthus roseus]|uniref:Uncharacterized protein n=1 Tax=Catharanthus roseus TaxID=4058 RepID=A0ACC0BRY8_CATRO|nr:hypothetical protein M9H77_06277 [Catharanthus roseus]